MSARIPSTASPHSTTVNYANRRVATGVLGVMRRAEERRRRQQMAGDSAAAYAIAHNMPETVDRLIATVLAARPDDPLALLEELLRQCEPDGSRRFGSGNGFGSERPPRRVASDPSLLPRGSLLRIGEEDEADCDVVDDEEEALAHEEGGEQDQHPDGLSAVVDEAAADAVAEEATLAEEALLESTAPGGGTVSEAVAVTAGGEADAVADE